MHSVHFVLAFTWEEPDRPVSFVFTDGTEARAAYEEIRDDPGTKHARLYSNPTPNGGVYDGAPPPPEEEETAGTLGALPPLPGSAYPPGSQPIPLTLEGGHPPAPPVVE